LDILDFVIIGFALGIIGAFFAFFIFTVRKGGLMDVLTYAFKGGSLVVKSNPDNSIEFKRYKKAPDMVFFDRRTEMGTKMKYNVKIMRVEHNLKGTSFPMHFCLFNQPHNININGTGKSEFGVKQIKEWGKSAFQTGWNARSALSQRLGGFDIEHIQLILAAIIAILAVVQIVMINSLFNVLSAG